MTSYAQRPWLAVYRDGQPSDLEVEFTDVLSMFASALDREPHRDVLRYFDGSWTVERLAAESDALAVALLDLGFAPGDRLVLFTQNDPAFVIGMLAAWKCGGIAVTANPMYKRRELGHVLGDSGATAVLCLDELHPVVTESAPGTAVRIVVTYSALDGQTRGDARVMPSERGTPVGTHDLVDLLGQHAGAQPPPVQPAGEDVCFLVYTSGTTGDPKGAQLTHANFAFNAQSFRDWIGLEPDEGILGIAPLFHITGLVGHAMLALLVPAPLVLVHRFEPAVVLDAIREHRPVFTIGAITAFTALSGAPGLVADDLASLTKMYSGGAPIAPAVADKLEARFGAYLHNAYGLTETSSITHLVPPDRRAPVDPESGALSVGVPISSTVARILDDDGHEVAVGEIGEVAISGPQVASGYWGRPDATATSFPNGELRTGDVGFMDADGWFYLVDRKKDMIIASGYKVWPREVEDVLYGHPAVREAAVVGVPDDYRGETVHAFVSLQDDAEVTADELIEHCKAQLAAYKYPRAVFFVDELPKTASGKILRRELR
ncbi:AMP-binding protein [Jatrophihabitans endophyticus]|uniref:AMP-binding protein n=1 Tax=Jatrophihabitans endophyticus TaxID=1206085 RepID=UPI0019F71EA0|nr:AMP-binding protein [Jatrophihabitans endophyticus]MBE7189537.1 AMP-binding protein [Jatrophihabitans endophyticus]